MTLRQIYISPTGPVYILALLAFTILNLISFRFFFFWDTVQLASRHAHFYYDTHFSSFLLPIDMDSGHPPFFGQALAILWKLFGRSLWISHLFILPFLWGIVRQVKWLAEHYFEAKHQAWAMVILLLQPTFLGQAVLVSPDIVLYFLLLLLLRAHLNQKRWLTGIAVVGLAMISMRGWMVAFIFFVFEALHRIIIAKKPLREIPALLIPYLPGGFTALLFLVYHFMVKGWIGYHADSPWAGSFERVDLKGFLYNLALYFWRLIDFGMVGVFAVFFGLFVFCRPNAIRSKKFKTIGLLFILMAVFLPSSMLLHKHLLAHRYLLPVLFMALLLTTYWLFEVSNLTIVKKRLMAVFMMLSLALGHLIIYPDTIAQAWDSSLAHMPYYQLRNQALRFMEQNHLSKSETGTFFPNKKSVRITDLQNDTTHFADFNAQTNRYVLYSNVFNDISDAAYHMLFTQWIPLKTFEKRGIKVIIFQSPKYESITY